MPISHVNTAKVQRRQLRFNSTDEVRREIDRIVAAENAGTLRSTGNWSPGQAFGHLAAWINYAWDGYPPQLNPPWFMRLLLRPLATRYARRGFPQGTRIPKVDEGTFATQPIETAEAAKRLFAALDRLDAGEPAKFHSPAFGRVSDEVRLSLQLRHAELHLGYFWPEPS
jgi:hypothetical protein